MALPTIFKASSYNSPTVYNNGGGGGGGGGGGVIIQEGYEIVDSVLFYAINSKGLENVVSNHTTDNVKFEIEFKIDWDATQYNSLLGLFNCGFTQICISCYSGNIFFGGSKSGMWNPAIDYVAGDVIYDYTTLIYNNNNDFSAFGKSFSWPNNSETGNFNLFKNSLPRFIVKYIKIIDTLADINLSLIIPTHDTINDDFALYDVVNNKTYKSTEDYSITQ